MNSHLYLTSIRESRISALRYLWLVIVCIAAFFVNSDVLQSDIMEARNLVTAHEMVEYDNWLTPTMNGDLRLNKPPLPTWIAGGIEIMCGESIWAQRCSAGVMGSVWAIFLFLTVKVISHRKNLAMLSTLIFVTCYSVVLMGRTATWDIYCHAFMQGALWLLYRIYYGATPLKTGVMVTAYIAAGVLLGLSFLSKGPVSFFALLLPFAITCAIMGRRPNKGNIWMAFAMIIITVAVSAWWYAYNYYFHPEIATTVLNKESGAWMSHNVRPFWYYWRFFLETGVWAILTLAALMAPLLSSKMRRDNTLCFGVIWILISVVFLSLMPEKKMRYLLPVMAPCAMSVGALLDVIRREWNKLKGWRVVFRFNGWVTTIIAAGIAGGVIYLWLGMGKISAWLAVVSAILIIGDAIFMAFSTVKGKIFGFVDAVSLLFIIIECMLMSQVTNFFVNPSLNSIKGLRTEKAAQQLPIYISDSQPVRMELVQAAGRRIIPLDFNNTDSVMDVLPCVLLSDKPISQTFSKEMLEKIDTIYIDTYDDNHHPITSKHYTSLLHKRATVLKLK